MYCFTPKKELMELYTRNMVPITRRMSSFLVLFCMHVNRKEEEEEEGVTEQQQTHQLTQGYNILYRLQVHHLTLTYVVNLNDKLLSNWN